ncbi:MAG TPA: glutathione peroxidase [Casimicrobiaceae bacterium]
MGVVLASPVAAADRTELHAAAPIAPSTAHAACPPLLRQNFNRLQTGEPQSLCQFQGKVLLVVNTASYCGFTPQYEALEAIYRKYRDRGLVVVGFPSNDFSQEPGTNKEIAEFCRTTYGVEFPQFEKSSVTSLAANPLYVELARQTGRKPQWNFFKFVIDRSGKPVATFGSTAEPDGREITALIEKLLAESPAPAKG